MTGGGWARSKYSAVADERSEEATAPSLPLQVVALLGRILADDVERSARVMGTLSWIRGSNRITATASPFQTNTIIAGLAAGETVRRSIVTFDWWVDSNSAQFIDYGRTVNYGISWSTSATAPTITPFTFASSVTPRWLYWDQLETRAVENFNVAGTIYYAAKNGNGSRYIDTRTQYKNATASAQHLWFSIEPDPSTLANWSDTYCTISSSVLIESP